jgi:hypothetical protein
MASFLIHIHTGPENPTKAALGFLVALSAVKAGQARLPQVGAICLYRRLILST